MDKPFNYKRIAIIGAAGSGKTTLGRALSKRLGLPLIELDALYWEPDWTPAFVMDFRERVEQTTAATAWIADGNYHTSRDIVWARAEALIWLDYGLWLSLGRVLRRTMQRVRTREELWNGNRENVWNQLRFWSNDSLIYWFFKTYWRRKREIPMLLKLDENKHLKLLHFKSPRELDEWLEGTITPPSSSSPPIA
jgi:adenylate kinase family enzyme